MNSLKQNYEEFIPLNRKERFYTGTVLPAIVCYNNFNYLNKFFHLIPGFNKDIKIYPDSDKNNILFQTEYSFKESLFEKGFKEKFNDNYETKDTPDLVILITEPDLVLFVGEAKMFSNVNAGEINNQMKNQEWFIQALQKGLNIKKNNCYHFALLPEKLIPSKQMINYPVIYWEEIVEEFKVILQNDYFLNVLNIATDKFDDLRAQTSPGSTISYGMNMDFRLSGQKIIELHNNGTKFWVGRFGGFSGNKFVTDIKTGGWRTFEYEINTTEKSAPNKNWFSSRQFIDAVKNTGLEVMINKAVNEESIQSADFSQTSDKWHFSHLGRDYFLNISLKIGYGGKWDSPIHLVYVGKTGVAYIEKKHGRNVNPNWSVVTKEGINIRCGNSGMIENGLWDKKKCNVFSWDEIKNFFINN